MKYKKSLLLVGVALFGCVALFSAGSVTAKINEKIVVNNSIGIAVSPMLSDRMNLEPGSVTEGKFRVRYPASETTEVFAEIAPYAAGEGNNYETGVFSKSSVYTKMTDWVTLGLEDCTINKKEAGRIYFTMRQQEECYVTYKIAVPKDAVGGSQHVAIFVQTIPNKEAKGDGAVINAYRIGYLLKNDIDGPGAKVEGHVVETKISGPLMFVPPITSSVKIANTGNLDFEAEHKMTVKTFFRKKEVYNSSKDNKDSNKALVMAETERVISNKWNGTPALGLFRVTQEATVLGETTTLTKTVLVIPIALIVAIIVAILLFVLWIYVKVKKNNKVRKSKK
ncbi:hypothetical protein FWG95_01600 [Candidatus Saccharibacteria bacterium]|nr:hypothetical protein [Candidatus Saccharibacteria bacterium]